MGTYRMGMKHMMIYFMGMKRSCTHTRQYLNIKTIGGLT
jgi:hypothetical protein